MLVMPPDSFLTFCSRKNEKIQRQSIHIDSPDLRCGNSRDVAVSLISGFVLCNNCRFVTKKPAAAPAARNVARNMRDQYRPVTFDKVTPSLAKRHFRPCFF